MDKQRFGKTQLQVTPVGFGAAPIGMLEIEQDRAASVLHRLLDAGVNLIDTAACYAGAEATIGSAVSHRRDEYVIVSKCGHRVDDDDGTEWAPALIRGSIERSLRRLKTDRIDVMVLHACNQAVLDLGEAWKALQDAQRAGHVRFIGYSGDNEEAAFAARLEGAAVIETSISIADQRNIDAVLPEACRQDLGVLAKRPIGNAAWKTAEEQQGLYADYAAEYHRRLKQMQLDPTALGIANESPDAWVELALRFTLSQKGGPIAIIGTTNPDHAAANLAAAEKGRLPAETVQHIRDAFTHADPQGVWRGLT